MEYRVVGKSGLKVSEIGLGGNDFGGLLDEKDSISVIHHALDSGINFIDTSDDYNGGRSEEVVGKAMQGRRPEVVLSTKFGGSRVVSTESGASRYHIYRALDSSLKRLGTDYIDLYYIHEPDLTTPFEETLGTLNDLIRSGKVRYIGCSNFAAWQLCEAWWISKLKNLEPFIVVQPPYNLLDRRIEEELVPCCLTYSIGVIPYWPLAEGFLSGSLQGKQVIPGTHLAEFRNKLKTSRLFTEENFQKVEKLQAFATEHGHSIAELAIAWLLAHPWLSSVIAGVQNSQHLSSNIAAANWKLTPQELTQLNELV